jgi:hypothetical protein
MINIVRLSAINFFIYLSEFPFRGLEGSKSEIQLFYFLFPTAKKITLPLVPSAHFSLIFWAYTNSRSIAMNAVIPFHNLPNLKQGQNGEEVALEIYGIVLDIKLIYLGRKKQQ